MLYPETLINSGILISSMILVYIVCKDKKEAKKISLRLLKKRLAACANLFSTSSLYWWKGKIINDNEFAIIAKTTNKNYEKIKSEVKKIHSYKIPCILKIKAGANEEYGAWVKKEAK